MKKWTALLLALILVPVCCGIAYSEGAEKIASGDYVYTLNADGSAVITGYTGMESDLAIPAELDGHPVTAIGEKAFNGNENLVSVTVPQGVQAVEKYAFSECAGLVSVSLPEGLLSIGDWAFMNDSGLSGLAIPETVTSLGLQFLYECYNITSLRIPDSVTVCSGAPVFSLNTPVEFIVSPDHPVFEVIDGVLFDKTRKELLCFRQADMETASYSIPEGTEIIGAYAFDCAMLTQVSIPASVKSIGEYAFNACQMVASFTLPEGLVSIGYRAFCGCEGMISVNIPDSVTEISNNIFEGCTALSDLRVSPQQAFVSLVDGVLFTRDGKRLIWYPPTSAAASYTVPDGTEVITGGVFRNAVFSSVTLPESLTVIESSAFAQCKQLKEITIPAPVTEIGKNAFARCEQMERIVLPEGLPAVENSTFLYCKALKEINIPESVTSIGNSAFRGCESLETLVIPAGVGYAAENAFGECPLLTLSVAAGSYMEQYCIDNGIPYTVR